MTENTLRLINVGSLFEQLATNIENRGKQPDLSIKSLPFLNERMWGINKKKLTVIGARPSNGKSAFAVQVCYDLAQQGKKVLFLSLEMENIECAERIASNALEINNRVLLQGEGAKYANVIRNLGKNLSKQNFIISDFIGRNWEEINTIIESWHIAKTVPDIIVLDYIQNIKGASNSSKESLDEYIRKFREMAIRYNFAGVLCSQINRVSQESKDKTPMLHQLKGCIHPDSLVGGKKIKEIVESNDYSKVKSFDYIKNENKNIVPSQLIHSGLKHCLRIKTKSGKEIILSKQTELFNGKEWVESKDCMVGNKILVEY